MPGRRSRVPLVLGVVGLIGILASGGLIATAILGNRGASVTSVPSPVAGGPTSTAPATAASAAPASAAASPAATARAAPLTLTVAVSLPVESDSSGYYQGIANGVQMAIDEANEKGLLAGITLHTRLVDYSDGAEKGESDMRALVDDPSVIGVVGPSHDYVAWLQIPISNAANLLQCAPQPDDPLLTIGRQAAGRRSAQPDRNSFVRLQVPADRQGEAIANTAWFDLGLRRIAVAEDGTGLGDLTNTEFETSWKALGGTIPARIQASDGISPKELRNVTASKADGVFFPGSTDKGGSTLRRALDDGGLRKVVMLGTRDIFDGTGDEQGSFINLTRGKKATGETYAAYPYWSSFLGLDGFETRYEERFGEEIRAFSSAGYVCGQVIVEAISRASRAGEVTRETVRASGATPGIPVSTAWGVVHFDANGDIVPGTMTIYKVNPELAGGGDWDWLWQVTLGDRGDRP